LRADGWLAPIALITAWALAATGVVIETLLLRGLIDLGQMPGLNEQRFGLVAATLILLVANLLIQFSITTNVLRLGRRLETRLRIAFLKKIPRLSDRYFQSRLISDMAERSHKVHRLRDVPNLGAELLRWVFTLILTTAGLIWLDPACAPIALLAATVSLGLPLALQPLLSEQDLRVRNHTGALGRFYLDALLGLVAIRTHGAERSVRREHEGLLVEWARARLRFQQVLVGLEGANSLLGFGLAAWLLFDHLARGGGMSDILLLVYWALNLPVIGQELATTIRQYPLHRNIVLRLIEPLGAPEEIVSAPK